MHHSMRNQRRPQQNQLRSLQLWVPDTQLSGYAQAIKEQCIALNSDAEEQSVLALTEAAMHDIEGWR
ncbi:hypothetical protein CCAE64S_01841 [Castellaniella caeni]